MTITTNEMMDKLTYELNNEMDDIQIENLSILVDGFIQVSPWEGALKSKENLLSNNLTSMGYYGYDAKEDKIVDNYTEQELVRYYLEKLPEVCDSDEDEIEYKLKLISETQLQKVLNYVFLQENLKEVAESTEDVYIQRMTLRDTDMYGFSDGLIYVQVSYDNYKRIQSIKQELAKSNITSKADISNYIYVDEIYEISNNVVFNNRKEIGKVHEAHVDYCEVDFDGNSGYICYSFKYTSGNFESEEQLFFSDIENFFAPIIRDN